MSSVTNTPQTYQYPPQAGNKYDINDLCNNYTRTVGSNLINVSALIERHKPGSEAELVEVINNHASATLDYCAKLTLARQRNVGCNYSYEEIYGFIYDLMVTKSLMGIRMERKTLRALQLKFPQYYVTCAGALDEKYAVDIVIEDEQGAPRACVQVKTKGYRDGTSEKIQRAKQSNLERNRRYQEAFGNIPILYYYYEASTKTFLNTEEFVNQVSAILAPVKD